MRWGRSLTDHLGQCLDDERSGRLQRSRAVWWHYPLSIEQGDVLRIEWDARPSIDVLLNYLQAAGVRIDPELRSEVDLTTNTTSDDELDELARRGELMALVRILRVRDRSLDLSQAREQASALIEQRDH